MDGDGDGITIVQGDCDDHRNTVYPGAPQLCDGIHNNCVGPGWPAVPSAEIDDDLDLYRECEGDCNDAAAALLGVPRHQIVGSRAGSFTRLDARIEDGDALWQALATKGRLHSLAVVRRPDGTETSVEFVTIANGDGPDRNVTVLREVADRTAPVARSGE